MRKIEIKLNDTQRELVAQNLKLVHKMWSELKNNWVKYAYRDDLISEGYIGLCYAAYRYNPELGAFSFVACNSIKFQMYKALKLIKRYTLKEISLQKVIRTADEEQTTLECVLPSELDLVADAEDADFVRDVLEGVKKRFTSTEFEMFKLHLMGYSYRKIAKFIDHNAVWVKYHMNHIKIFLQKEYTKAKYN